VQIRITRPARKHRIGNQHILEAMRNAGDPVIEGDAMVYIGLDDRGVELEVVAYPTTSTTAVSPSSTRCRPR